MIDVKLPRSTVNDRLSTATTPPNRLDAASTSTIAVILPFSPKRRAIAGTMPLGRKRITPIKIAPNAMTCSAGRRRLCAEREDHACDPREQRRGGCCTARTDDRPERGCGSAEHDHDDEIDRLIERKRDRRDVAHVVRVERAERPANTAESTKASSLRVRTSTPIAAAAVSLAAIARSARPRELLRIA